MLKLELLKNAPLFAKTNLIFEISVSFSTIYQKIVLALQFSFKFMRNDLFLVFWASFLFMDAL